MSASTTEYPRLRITPEPESEELVAILIAMQRTDPSAIELSPKTSSDSFWSQIARREQMRRPLDERRQGWTR